MIQSSMFRNILYPTDFSKSSQAIIDHVVGLADAFKAKVWLLSVVASLEGFHGESESYYGPFSEAALVRMDADRKTRETECLRQLTCLQQQYFQRVASEVRVKSGGVAELIVDYADEIKADLIMMPTHGLGRSHHFGIGSVIAKVLHDSSCRVWTSPHPQELEPFRLYRHIILAVNYHQLSVALLMRASELVKAFQGQLSVLSALTSLDSNYDEAHKVEAHESANDVAKAIRCQIVEAGIKATVRVMEGAPGDVVAQIAEQVEAADLILLGRGHLQDPMGKLRTHCYEIIRNSPCPVISL